MKHELRLTDIFLTDTRKIPSESPCRIAQDVLYVRYLEKISNARSKNPGFENDKWQVVNTALTSAIRQPATSAIRQFSPIYSSQNTPAPPRNKVATQVSSLAICQRPVGARLSSQPEFPASAAAVERESAAEESQVGRASDKTNLRALEAAPGEDNSRGRAQLSRQTNREGPDYIVCRVPR